MAVFFKRISELLLNHLRNELTKAEQRELEQWIASSEKNRRLFDQLTTNESFRQKFKEYHDVRHTIFEKTEAGIAEQPVLSIAPKKYLLAAAVIGVLVTAASHFFLPNSSSEKKVTTSISSVQQLSSILPGGNGATLTIGGPVIYLASVVNGIIEIGNSKVVKLRNGELEYKAAANQQQSFEYSTLSTTQNGPYKISLYDCTQAWLNAVSSTKYPNVFIGAERIVEITGEVYFEVAHNKGMPFIVNNANSDVAVRALGTHFTVNDMRRISESYFIGRPGTHNLPTRQAGAKC